MDRNGLIFARPFRIAAAAVVLVLAFLAGYRLRAPAEPAALDGEVVTFEVETEEGTQVWTCSMHPQIRMPEPGLCPICHMELVPVEDDDPEVVGERVFVTTPEAAALMDVETVPVQRKRVSVEVPMVGKVEYDERLVKNITSWIGGRIDRLHVDFTGVTVERGSPMAEVYSPTLRTAEQELLQAIKATAALSESASDFIREAADRAVESAREKLRLLGLKSDQIARIEERGAPADHVTVKAPIGGTVIRKHVQEGMYVDTGSPIYSIADLSHVWVLMDAYESDIMWIADGREVTFTTISLPGEKFTGNVAFVDPFLGHAERSVKVRVDVPNPRGRLKPGMFVSAVLKAGIGEADDLPLVIPASAPLLTGKRAVVYVHLPSAEQPTFEGREVLLGERAGDYYVVREGLEEGELVVTRGGVKIDSAMQILARPAMMAPEGAPPPHVHDHDHHAPHDHHDEPTEPAPHVDHAVPSEDPVDAPQPFQEELGTLWQAYVDLGSAMADDDFESARAAVERSAAAHAAVSAELLDEEARVRWRESSQAMGAALGSMQDAEDLEGVRAVFEGLSLGLADAIRTFGIHPPDPVYVLHCPMVAAGRGAVWLQNDRDVRNPYFGAMMLRCGSVVETIADGSGNEGHVHE